MLRPRGHVALGRPDWLENLEGWVARVAPAILADVIDVLAAQLRERDIGDHETSARSRRRCVCTMPSAQRANEPRCLTFSRSHVSWRSTSG
jgi:hypothetical protein